MKIMTYLLAIIFSLMVILMILWGYFIPNVKQLVNIDQIASLITIGVTASFLSYSLIGKRRVTQMQDRLYESSEEMRLLIAEISSSAHRFQEDRSLIEDQLDQLIDYAQTTTPRQIDVFSKTVRDLAELADGNARQIANIVVRDPIAAAEQLEALAQENGRRTAKLTRQAAQLYAPFSPSKALAAYTTVVVLDPADTWSWIELGRLRFAYDGIDAARRCFDMALQQAVDERDRVALHIELADLEMALGNLGAARKRYGAGLVLAEQRLGQEPGDAERQRDLSVSY